MRLTILIFTILSLHLGLRAQSSNPAEAKRWKSGYIISLHDDTIAGKIKGLQFLDTYYDYQHKLAFEHEGVVTEYLAVDIKGFAFTDDSAQLRTFESLSDPRGGGHIMSRVYCKGSCSVYGLTSTLTRESETTMGATGNAMAPSLLATEKKYIQLGRNEFFPLRQIGFKKIMKEFFASCPYMVEKLESKQYTYDNWQQMVRDYNTGPCKNAYSSTASNW